MLRKTVGDMQTHSAAVPVTDGVVRLKVVGTAVEYRFSVATEAGAWQEVGRGLTQLLATELASTWGGLLIGMYARAHGAPEPAPADFDILRVGSCRSMIRAPTGGITASGTTNVSP